MTSKETAVLRASSVARRHVASAKRHARGATVILLALAMVFLTKQMLSTSYATWIPLQRTCALANGALHADRYQALGSRILMMSQSVLSDVPHESDVQEEISNDTLRIGKLTKTGKLAQVLKRCVLDPKRKGTYGLCKGGNATTVALKSVIIANKALEETASVLSSDGVGKRLVMMPKVVEVVDNGVPLKMQEVHFQLAPVGPVPAGAVENTLLVGMKTNIGKLAGAMLGRIEQHGEAVLTMIGDNAIYNAVRATAIAFNMTSNRNPTDVVQLALLPSWYNTSQPSGRIGVEMRCFKI